MGILRLGAQIKRGKVIQAHSISILKLVGRVNAMTKS